MCWLREGRLQIACANRAWAWGPALSLPFLWSDLLLPEKWALGEAVGEVEGLALPGVKREALRLSSSELNAKIGRYLMPQLMCPCILTFSEEGAKQKLGVVLPCRPLAVSLGFHMNAVNRKEERKKLKFLKIRGNWCWVLC